MLKGIGRRINCGAINWAPTAFWVVLRNTDQIVRTTNRPSPEFQVQVLIRCKSERLCYTKAMIIGASAITLHLPECHSLKEKRQVVKSVLARVRNQFEVAIAEVDENDRWQIALLGVTCVSNSSQHANNVLEHVRHYIEESRPDVVISHVESELIHW